MTWLTNPLANHLFAPFAILLLALLGCAACALFLVQQWRLSHGGSAAQTAVVAQHVLWQRYRTWAIIGVLFAAAVFCGPLVMAALCVFLCWQGTREYAALTVLAGWQQTVLACGGLLTYGGVLIVGPSVLSIAPVLAFFIWSLLTLQPLGQGAETGQRFNAGLHGLWGYFYLGWLPAYILALSCSKFPGLALTVGLGVALSDVGAFCAGKALGGAKLAPRLSPNKTWGGVLGNVLGAALALALTSYALPHLQLWQLALFTLAIAVGSIWGDLLESLLKRQCGVKDAGALLPGFGGLLDRIDSLLIVAPLVYYLALLLFS
jgi:phosphatidate cytidylyltransferase